MQGPLDFILNHFYWSIERGSYAIGILREASRESRQQSVKLPLAPECQEKFYSCQLVY